MKMKMGDTDTADSPEEKKSAFQNVLLLLHQPPANRSTYRAFREACLQYSWENFSVPKPLSWLETEATDWVSYSSLNTKI